MLDVSVAKVTLYKSKIGSLSLIPRSLRTIAIHLDVGNPIALDVVFDSTNIDPFHSLSLLKKHLHLLKSCILKTPKPSKLL